MSLYDSDKYRDIEEANIVAQSFRAPKDAIPKDFIKRVRNITGGGYAKMGMEKNVYTIRGGIIGGLIFAGLGMYYKKGVWGFGIVGIAVGSITGFAIGNFILNHKNNKQDATSN